MSVPVTQLRNQLPQQREEPKSFPAMLERYKSEIARALPKHMNADRMTRVALTEFRKNPQLGKCDPTTVFASIIIGSQLGLEPGIMGQAFLVPYYNKLKSLHECQFIPGWQGLCDIVNRSGRASVWTGAVYEGDEFDFAFGDRPFVKHKPAGLDDDPSKLLYVYAVGRVKDSEWPVIEVWPVAKVVRHRNKYNKVGEKHYSYNNFEMYARKVPLLQVIKYMPKSVELATAVALENAAEMGGQDLNLKDVIDGTWTPVTPTQGDDAPDNQPTPTASTPATTTTASASATAATTSQAGNESERGSDGGSEGDAGRPSFEEIIKSINAAKDAPALDKVISLINEVRPVEKQPMLRGMAENKLRRLTERGDVSSAARSQETTQQPSARRTTSRMLE